MEDFFFLFCIEPYSSLCGKTRSVHVLIRDGHQIRQGVVRNHEAELRGGVRRGLLNIEREAEVFLDIIDSGGSVGGPVRRGRAPARYIGKPVQLRGLACGCSAVIRRGSSVAARGLGAAGGRRAAVVRAGSKARRHQGCQRDRDQPMCNVVFHCFILLSINYFVQQERYSGHRSETVFILVFIRSQLHGNFPLFFVKFPCILCKKIPIPKILPLVAQIWCFFRQMGSKKAPDFQNGIRRFVSGNRLQLFA